MGSGLELSAHAVEHQPRLATTANCPHCGAKMVEYEDYESESGEGENHDND